MGIHDTEGIRAMVDDYFSGKTISNCYQFKISKPEKTVPLRIEMLEDLVRNKKIIDLGFADHIELIKMKLDKDEWLHKRLSESARRCLGIDINWEAVYWCKRNTPLSNIICANIEKNQPIEIMDYDWDYLIMGELIEHQDSPVEFLKIIKEKYSERIKSIIITTPNAFRIQNFWFAKKHLELINSDHRFWFTPYTLSKVVTQAGYKVNWFKFCQSTKIPFYKFPKKFLLKRYPAFRDTIIMEIQ